MGVPPLPPISEELRAKVAEDIDRNGDLVRKREDARRAQDVAFAPLRRLVSTEEKKAITNTPTESVLGKAHRLVQGKRGAEYGHPLDNHTTTAQMFAAYLQRKYELVVPLDAEDVCMMNVLQKVSREANEPQEDNLVDIAGYVFNIELVRGERDRRTRTND